MRADQTSSATRRLVLRPGVHMLRRSASELQLGLDPRRAIVLPDRAEVRDLLRALASPASPLPEGYDAGTLELLAAGNLLVDADTLLPLVPTGPVADSPLGRGDVAAIAARDGDAVGRLAARRSGAHVEVVSCGGPGSADVAATLAGLLVVAGLPHHVAGRERAGRRDTAAGEDAPSTGVLVCVGEPARERLDPWMRAGTPHLLIRLVEGSAVVGPFVVPGHTACVRCVDAHHTDVDPAWPLLVAQYASAVARPREDTVPEPLDPILATLASSWAARELVSHAEGTIPSTTSVTIRLDPRLTAMETHAWPRHPACGCAWS